MKEKNVKRWFLYLSFILISIFASKGICQDSQQRNEISQEVFMKVLDNNLKVIIKKSEANDLFAAVCMIDIGSLYEPTDKVGITNFVQNMLLKGTKKRSAEEIANAIESVGGKLNTSASDDFADASVLTLAEDYDLALEILSDILFNPTFTSDEVEKERRLILDYIKLQEDESFSFIYKNFLKTIYSGHPYEFQPEGVPETINTIQAEDLIEHHKNYYVPSNMILSIVGNVNPDSVLKKVKKYFSQPSPAKPTKIRVSKEFDNSGKRVVLTKKVNQGFLSMGYITAPISSEDYCKIRVANAIIGEGMSSKLFVELRDKKGLAYHVGSLTPTRRDKSHIMGFIGTKPESLEESRVEMLRVFNSMVENEPTQDELDRAKNYIIGKFLIGHETNIRQAFYPAWYEVLGIGYKFDKMYPQKVKEVTSKDILKVCNKYFLTPTVVLLEPEK